MWVIRPTPTRSSRAGGTGSTRCGKSGGISGFPRREESLYDVFNVGHSSTSISAAAGIAEARCLKGENFKVIAVIGDGSMSAGMAFEGLNWAGDRKKNLIIILNDNEMSHLAQRGRPLLLPQPDHDRPPVTKLRAT